MAPPKLVNPLEKYLGALTFYHYYVFVLIFLSKMPLVWHVLSLIFLSPPMSYYCEAMHNDEAKNKCPCTHVWWDKTIFTETMQTKFSLFCDTSWCIAFSHSVTFFGVLVGCFMFGYLSDRFGRLVMYSYSCLTIAISGCLVAAMPTIWSYTFMRFINGIGVGGSIVTSFVLCVEYCATKHREIITALFHIPINVGHILLAGVSYILRDFDHFQLAISVPIFLIFPIRWLMMESPKWLMDNGKIEELANGLVKFNRQQSSASIKEEFEKYIATERKPDPAHKVGFFTIFKNKDLSINFLAMGVIYFVCGMGYYGVSQFIGEMSGNIHANVAISGASLIPGTLVCTVLLKVLGRRPLLMASLLLSGFFMFTVVLTPSSLPVLRVALACICNCFFFVSFIVAFLYGVELFPTSIRTSVLGILAVIARIGQIIAPPINSLSQFKAAMFFGTVAIVGGFLCYFLPETKGVHLPATMEEAHQINKRYNTRGSAVESS